MGVPMQTQMTSEQPLSVPRRALDVEDYIDILRRHRSWILAPTFLGLVLGVVTAYLWPDSYMATGLIRVVPPAVPTRLVQTNIVEEMTARINTTYQDIIERKSLLNLIQTYNLYPDERKRLPTDDVVEKMRTDIGLGQMQYLSRGAGTLRQNINAFAVSFSYSDRRLAQKVCAALVSKFAEESVKARSTASVMTTEFFKDQYEVAKRELDEADAKITQFRQRNMGELPEQEQMVMGRITAMEANIQAVNGQISRAHSDKLQLETQLRDMRDQAQSLAQPVPEQMAAPASAPRNDRVAELDREIQRTEASLAVMRESYKDSHPGVQRVQSYLNSKQKERDLALREAESARVDTPAQRQRMVANPANQQRLREVNSSIGRLQAALQAKDMEIEDLNRQMNDLRSRLRTTQARLESSPAANQEYVQLMRDRTMASTRYEELSHKMQESSMATDLESRGQGEMLQVLEVPAIPDEPYAPKRPLIVGVGLLIGVGLGIALAGGREVRDSSLKNLKDVRAYTRLTVLGSIPLLENDFIVRRRRRMGWLAWTAGFLVGVLLMAGSIIYYYTSRG
jgi:polysaccharide chain length determinant protein (PEP-CTERM system associated)